MSRATPLKIAIVTSGISQREIAEKIDCHPSHLSRIVNGLRCDDETQAAIASVIGRTVSELWPVHDVTSDQHDADLKSTHLRSAA